VEKGSLEQRFIDALSKIKQNMEVIVRSLLGIEPAVLEWDAPFEPPPAGPEEEAAMKLFKALG
jgi:hypothetical protein